MILGVQDIYYYVSDMQRAVAFYTGVLGMSLIEESEYWSSLECGGVNIGLHGNEGRPVPPIGRDSHGAFAGGTLTLKSDDISGDRARLEQADTVILGESDEEWGHMLIFEDPDGNVLKLMKPKS